MCQKCIVTFSFIIHLHIQLFVEGQNAKRLQPTDLRTNEIKDLLFKNVGKASWRAVPKKRKDRD